LAEETATKATTNKAKAFIFAETNCQTLNNKVDCNGTQVQNEIKSNFPQKNYQFLIILTSISID
jgi:hypothetical protein